MFETKEKSKLLEHYKRREPQTFFQFDGFAHETGDCVFHPDDDGDCLFRTITKELMHGADVRLFIRDGTNKEEALRLLRKITEWVQRHDDEVFNASADEARERQAFQRYEEEERQQNAYRLAADAAGA